ncbi:MAG: tRNA (adenosine(37)-N6)-threonylcarbamoyltransferase complex dimerization subunit type 1 TsaB [Phycisphaerales bacterium]|nr:tRNA (adenosine(37)-N6)-threonylcarbamoyltransferase complex dimerization subunit type 1 TsaB [Phycisphaerales bacterium]
MSYLLLIDTACKEVCVGIAKENQIIDSSVSPEGLQHAYSIHGAISDMFAYHKIAWHDIVAVAVVQGPGSYTGLRVGMAIAKGICFALSIPLIGLNTLDVMAANIQKLTAEQLNSTTADLPFIYCPMIDARRMEVFTALYTTDMEQLVPPQPLVLTKDFFTLWLSKYRIISMGSGSLKCMQLLQHDNFIRFDTRYNWPPALHLVYRKLNQADFLNLETAVPTYYKEFYTIGQ